MRMYCFAGKAYNLNKYEVCRLSGLVNIESAQNVSSQWGCLQCNCCKVYIKYEISISQMKSSQREKQTKRILQLFYMSK